MSRQTRRIPPFSLSICVIALVAFAGSAPAGPVQYQFIDLHDEARVGTVSNGFAISDGRQFGMGSPSDSLEAFGWSGSAGSAFSMQPSGYGSSTIKGASGGQQVGFIDGDPTGGRQHAAVWSGTADSAIDIHPAQFQFSEALAIGGAQIVGYVSAPTGQGGGNVIHAALWTGPSADGFVDLNPDGFRESNALGVGGGKQGGLGIRENGESHALLWSGSADSFVDLNPAGFDNSRILGLSETHQVGFGSNAETGGALLWSGTAESVILLHPDGYAGSSAQAVNGDVQVGRGVLTPGGLSRALVWFGSADSVIDLHALLPSEYTASVATGVDASGNIVGYARFREDSNDHAVMWTVATPIPLPPAVLGALPAMAVAFAAWRRMVRPRS